MSIFLKWRETRETKRLRGLKNKLRLTEGKWRGKIYIFKRLDVTNITIPYEIENTQGPRYTKGVLSTFGNKLDRKEIQCKYIYI